MLLVLRFSINSQTKPVPDPDTFFPSPPPPPGLSSQPGFVAVCSVQPKPDPLPLNRVCCRVRGYPALPPTLGCGFLHSGAFRPSISSRGAHVGPRPPERAKEEPESPGFPFSITTRWKTYCLRFLPRGCLTLSWSRGDGVQPTLFCLFHLVAAAASGGTGIPSRKLMGQLGHQPHREQQPVGTAGDGEWGGKSIPIAEAALGLAVVPPLCLSFSSRQKGKSSTPPCCPVSIFTC